MSRGPRGKEAKALCPDFVGIMWACFAPTLVPAPASCGHKESSVMDQEETSSNQETPPALISGRASLPSQMPPPDAPVTLDPPNSPSEQAGMDTSTVIIRWPRLTAGVWVTELAI